MVWSSLAISPATRWPLMRAAASWCGNFRPAQPSAASRLPTKVGGRQYVAIPSGAGGLAVAVVGENTQINKGSALVVLRCRSSVWALPFNSSTSLANRQTIQHLAMELPGGQMCPSARRSGCCGSAPASAPVPWTTKVFEALDWLLGQLGVEANRVCCVVAAPPHRLHPLHEEALDPHAQPWLPAHQHWRHGLL